MPGKRLSKIMMKLASNIKLLPIAIFIFTCYCSFNKDSKLNSAIDEYLEKKPNAHLLLEHALIDSISLESIVVPFLQSNGTILYKINENNIDIFYPITTSFSLADGDGIKHIDMNDNYAVIADEFQLSIFDNNGNHHHDETIGDKKNQIKALLLEDENVIYYKNSKLYRYNIINNTSQQLLKDTFQPPFAQYYNVFLYRIESLISVVAGMAGSYNLSIIHITDETVILKNFAIASSKFYFNKDIIYYITGNSGNWQLMQYSIALKTKKSIEKFTDIVDIELTGKGYVLETSKGLYAAEYGKEKIFVPFFYQLAGKFRGRIILKYKDAYYIINSKRLFTSLNKLKERIPALVLK